MCVVCVRERERKEEREREKNLALISLLFSIFLSIEVFNLNMFFTFGLNDEKSL